MVVVCCWFNSYNCYIYIFFGSSTGATSNTGDDTGAADNTGGILVGDDGDSSMLDDVWPPIRSSWR